MQIRISVKLPPELGILAERLDDPRPLMAALGKRLEIELRAHFAQRDAEPNKQGWPSRHFWARQVRRFTALTEVTPRRAVVTIAAPEFAFKLTGGTLTPKRARSLAIPANAEAYKAGSPREADVDQLDYIPINKGNLAGLLVRRLQTILKKTRKGLTGKMVGGDVWYYCVRRANIPRDPRALPDEAALDAALEAEASATLERLLPR